MRFYRKGSVNADCYDQYKKQATDIIPVKRVQWEKKAQKQAVAWFHWKYPHYYFVFYHIANEGKRDIGFAKSLKAMGMKKGMLDLHLDVPSTAEDGKFYYGLRIEMKPHPDDSQSWVSPEQEKTITEMNTQGYHARVCYGFDEFKKCVEWYFFNKDVKND